MKKTYEIPKVLRRDNLSAVTSGATASLGDVSDSRVKTDITPIGATVHGLALYTWRYLGQPEVWKGVLAQDVLRRFPEAVGRNRHGFLKVDYSVLGLKLERVE